MRLPEPGGDQELADWAGEFYSQRLDRTRPLWEIALVEGLANDRWALATKTHHCMVDGVGSVDVAYVMLDSEPDGRAPDAPDSELPPGRVQPVPSPDAGLVSRGTGALGRVASRGTSIAMRPVRGALGLASAPGRAREALHSARALVEVIIRDELIAAPKTSLNVPIGGKRRLGVTAISLAEIKQLKDVARRHGQRRGSGADRWGDAAAAALARRGAARGRPARDGAGQRPDLGRAPGAREQDQLSVREAARR